MLVHGTAYIQKGIIPVFGHNSLYLKSPTKQPSKISPFGIIRKLIPPGDDAGLTPKCVVDGFCHDPVAFAARVGIIHIGAHIIDILPDVLIQRQQAGNALFGEHMLHNLIMPGKAVVFCGVEAVHERVDHRQQFYMVFFA